MDPRERAEVWDLLVCEDCGHEWRTPDRDPTWNENPEPETAELCPSCHSSRVVREERA